LLQRRRQRRRQQAEAAYSPTDISELALWLDAADTSTIHQTSGSVSQWDDKSGHSNHVSQATAARQPTTGANTQNGKNVLDFDGDFLVRKTFTGGALPQPNTIFVVYQHDAIEPVSEVRSFIYDGGDNTPEKRHVLYLNDSSGGRYYFSGTPTDTGSPASTGQFYIDALVYDSPNSEYYVNGGSALSSSDDTGAQDLNGITLGDVFGQNTLYPFVGKIAELVVYGKKLSVAEMNQEGGRLKDKWGLTWSNI
jgi:hypothetical protein